MWPFFRKDRQRIAHRKGDPVTDDITIAQPRVELGATRPGGSHTEQILKVRKLPELAPLNLQLGAEERRTAPAPLWTALFENQPTKPDRNTYAVLDAAKVSSLPMLLEGSGLEHRCLFTGNAKDELAEAAPWLVKLEADHDFTRNLFTSAGLPSNLWDLEPGIYLRTADPIEDVLGHLRRFTKATDSHGKWFIFRFWDPRVLEALPGILEPMNVQRLFPSGWEMIYVCIDPGRGGIVHLA